MHIYWKRFEFNACLPTADPSSADDSFPAFVMVASLFLPHFRVLFLFPPSPPPLLISVTHCSFCLSVPALFFSFRRREYCSGVSRLMTVCGFVEPVSQSGNRRGAVPPPSRRTRINSACDSRGHDCRCAGRRVIF